MGSMISPRSLDPENDASADPAPARSRVLAVNVGSSSLKFALFTAGDPPERLASGRVEKIGLPDAGWTVADAGGRTETRRVDAADHAAAVRTLTAWLVRTAGLRGRPGITSRLDWL